MLIRKAILADAGAIAQVHIDSWRTTYRGLISNHFLADLSLERSESNWASFMAKNCRKNFLLVVEDPAHSIVGFAAGGPIRTGNTGTADNHSQSNSNQAVGEIYAMYLLAGHQRCGLGSRLLSVAAQELLVQGINSMIVWVLADNSARHFYSSHGGREWGYKAIEIAGSTLEEVAYYWQNLEALSSQTLD